MTVIGWMVCCRLCRSGDDCSDSEHECNRPKRSQR